MTLKLSRAEAARLGIKGSTNTPAKPKGPARKGRVAASSEDDSAAISFLVPLKPQPKHRPRTFIDESSMRKAFREAKGNIEEFVRRLRMKTVTTKETKAFEKAVAQAAGLAMRGRDPFPGPVKVTAVFMFEGADHTWPVAQGDGDLDNLEKSFADALNGIVYTDDRMTVSHRTYKVCVDGPAGIFIRVEPAQEDVLAEALALVSGVDKPD